MRIIGPIFLIIFVIATVYLTKDDAILFLEKIEKNKIFQSSTATEEDSNNDTQNTGEVGADLDWVQQYFKKEFITPGPLTKKESSNSQGSGETLSPQKIIENTNSAREDTGLSENLVFNSKLQLSAQKKIDDMLLNDYFEHVSPTGVAISDLIETVGYDYIIVGENLALGNFQSEKELVDAWMASPGHRANILNNKYKDIGVAVGHGTISGKKVFIAVQHFGASSNVCPSINQQLKTLIEEYSATIEQKAGELESQKQELDEAKMYEKGYEEKMNSYNNNVRIYNEIVETVKKNIQEYNNQVNTFNFCVQNFEE